MQTKTVFALCLVTIATTACALPPPYAATRSRVANPIVDEDVATSPYRQPMRQAPSAMIDTSPVYPGVDRGRDGRIGRTDNRRLEDGDEDGSRHERDAGDDLDRGERGEFSRFEHDHSEPNGGTHSNALEVREQNGIAFITGGTGKEEQAAIESMGGRFSLQLLFAVTRGDYLADVSVRILDARGNVVLDTTSRGPFLYADLPSGVYTVEARFHDDTKRQNVRVGPRGPQRVSFYWDTSAAASG